MNASLANLPYCGLPPEPAELWSRWNFDPYLLGALLVAMIWHARSAGVWRSDTDATPSHTYFTAGWTAALLGLISPLCALSVALFSARIAQHMWLVLVAAPLLAFASSPGRERQSARGPKFARSTVAASALFACCLWGWHAPSLYALTFASDLAYWSMHGSLMGSALFLWRSIACANGLARVGAAFLTFVQMGLLGALLALAPRSLYVPHLLSAPLWGLSPLEDQQLGGLIMWIPAGFILVFAALCAALDMLRVPGPHSAHAR